MTLKFKEWDELNEGQILSSIKNWISGNFGGSVEKLDRLIYDMKKAETDYIHEWEDLNSDIDQLEIKLQGNVDPAMEKSTLRMIERKKQILNSIRKKKEVELENIFRKVGSIIKSNRRLKDYWEKEKSQADVDIAKRMYDIAKSLGDDDMASTLYDKYKKFVDKSTKLESSLSRRYKDKITKETSAKSDEKFAAEGGGLESIARKSLSEFESIVKDLDRSEAAKLVKICTDIRNKLYVDMDLEIARLNDKIKEKKDKDFTLEAERNIKKIKEEYLEKIRGYRSKITLAKRYS